MKVEDAPRKTRIIGIGNQKGGVAKTTNAIHLAAALGELGRLCLIIDCDANHGATSSFGIEGSGWQGTFELMLGEEEPRDLVITAEEDDVSLPRNVHLIPATRQLENVDSALHKRFGKFVREQEVLRAPLKKLEGVYDYVFLDTGPNASTPTLAAYAAADWFLLSAMPEPMAVENLGDALRDIEDAQRTINPPLRLLGVILTAANKRTNISRRLTGYVEDVFREGDRSAKLSTVISRSTVVPEAQEDGKTLFELYPAHKVTEEYRALAREFEARLHDLEKKALSDTPGEPVEATFTAGVGNG